MHARNVHSEAFLGFFWIGWSATPAAAAFGDDRRRTALARAFVGAVEFWFASWME